LEKGEMEKGKEKMGGQRKREREKGKKEGKKETKN
jgi:hypothetical protein